MYVDSPNQQLHRAIVTFTNPVNGEIRVKIPAVTGLAEVSISQIGRKQPWVLPAVGETIVVGADDDNMTNIFWVQTNPLRNLEPDIQALAENVEDTISSNLPGLRLISTSQITSGSTSVDISGFSGTNADPRAYCIVGVGITTLTVGGLLTAQLLNGTSPITTSNYQFNRVTRAINATSVTVSPSSTNANPTVANTSWTIGDIIFLSGSSFRMDISGPISASPQISFTMESYGNTSRSKIDGFGFFNTSANGTGIRFLSNVSLASGRLALYEYITR